MLSLLSHPTLAKGIEYSGEGLRITLAEEVEIAVNSGVPLAFVCEYALVTEVLFVKWTRDLKQHRFLVKHHTLSSSYLVSDNDGVTPKIFLSTEDTMAFIAEQAMAEFANYTTADHRYQMRVRLSKYDLPGPMRLNAFISNDWDLNSGWIPWPSAQ